LTQDEIRISVVGTGRMGYFHARLLARLGYLDSVVDINPQTAKKVGQQFERPWFSSVTALAEEQSPNGVIIAVPTTLHSNIALEIVKKIPKIKALLIEKPVAPSQILIQKMLVFL
jgi:predicted dehydrogenase